MDYISVKDEIPRNRWHPRLCAYGRSRSSASWADDIGRCSLELRAEDVGIHDLRRGDRIRDREKLGLVA